MKILRSYQEAALKSLFNWLFTAGSGHPLVVAPVGSGKSLLIAETIRRIHEMYPRTRIIVLTHVKELLEQNSEELLLQYPTCDFGYYCAGLKEKKLYNDVTFASVQSICNKIGNFNRAPEIIMVDECHLISHDSDTQYRKFFNSVHSVNPNCKIIGFTGTPFRADSGRLDEGEGKLFDGIAYEIPMSYMIEEGYWARPVTPQIDYKMDVSGVGTRGGDYIECQLEAKINTHEVNDACVRRMLQHGENRRKWLVFTAGIKHCEDVLEEIKKAGVSAAMVTGDTQSEERKQIIEDFRNGRIRCLVNVAVLTTGFNVPDIDMLVFMRPTRSPVLYIQTTGRGVRPVYATGFDLSTKEGRLNAIANSHKKNVLILDFGGVIDTLGPIDMLEIRSKTVREKVEGEKVAPIVKICPSCGETCMPSQRYCFSCGYCFISLEDDAASGKAVVSNDVTPEWYDVLYMNVGYHKKKKKNESDPEPKPTMVVNYATMAGNIKEWICFEHIGYAKEKALKWYDKFTTHDWGSPPETIEEGVEKRVYRTPTRILIRKEGKFWRVLDYDFTEKKEENIILDDYIPF